MRIRYSAMLIILPVLGPVPGWLLIYPDDRPAPESTAGSAVPGGPRGGPLGLRPQRLNSRGRVVGTVDCRAGHEHVGPRLGAPLDRFLAHSAVDLKPHRRAVPLDQCPRAPQLRQHQVEEVLATEA